MADKSDTVTAFFLNTCRLRPQLSKHAMEGILCCATVVEHESPGEAKGIPLITGSVAEFYIEPMLPHVSDIDIMRHLITELAIPRGHPPPTQLPDEFHSYVRVFEIVDSEFPGYVYLRLRYLLIECNEDGEYNAVEYDSEPCAIYLQRNVCVAQGLLHGPAVLVPHNEWSLPKDIVDCVRCFVWPSQAFDWPKRHRNYGWPDSPTVDRVVSNGCDVVLVAHRQCRPDNCKRQQRLSFSRAEIVLINSWMPEQQIIYHMLRFFMKTERLTDSANNSGASKLSNYHIKTLMLWACELKPRSWWTETNFCSICVELMHDLAYWLSTMQCPQYFINKCNLTDNLFDMSTIVGSLSAVTEPWLSIWFVNNYIRTCSQLCPKNVSRLFVDISSSRPTKLQRAVLAIVNWRMNITLEQMLHVLLESHSNILLNISRLSLNIMSMELFICELTTLNKSLSVYFNAVALLHVAHKISINVFSDEWLDVLATLSGYSVGTRRYFSRTRSEVFLGQAAKLMKVVANKSRSTVQLIEIELSKAYLYRALRCYDSDSDGMYNCLANVYLALLYYTTGQYQTVINHCAPVTRSQDHSQCSSHVVQGELLPKIDDDIDNSLGLSVLYQYVRACALNQQQRTQHVSVFTTEFLAQYLLSRSVAETLSDGCVPYISQTMYISDVLALKSIVHKPTTSLNSYEPTVNPAERDTSQLVELLQKSAVERLTSYRQLLVRDFCSIATIVTTDFEALYAYKHGDYQRCLQLSTQNVHTLLSSRSRTVIVEFLTFPEFIQLMDDDIVSLTALTLIINPKFRRHGSFGCISQLTLSLYLMAQCQLKLHHSVTSLALTLDYIEIVQRRLKCNTFPYVLLKFAERKLMLPMYASLILA